MSTLEMQSGFLMLHDCFEQWPLILFLIKPQQQQQILPYTALSL